MNVCVCVWRVGVKTDMIKTVSVDKHKGAAVGKQFVMLSSMKQE